MPFLAKSGENICKYGSFVVPLPNKFSENKYKTTKINDQRMKINEVIERHGMQLRDVSREMGMKPSALQSAIDRNLTVKTLRQISEAARIPIAEFFMDEMTQEEISRLTDRPAPDPSLLGRGVDAPEQQAIEQPKENEQPSALVQGALICPHCHKPFTVEIKG
jgi:lambda repressor-like predicted transcriptional regulator